MRKLILPLFPSLFALFLDLPIFDQWIQTLTDIIMFCENSRVGWIAIVGFF